MRPPTQTPRLAVLWGVNPPGPIPSRFKWQEKTWLHYGRAPPPHPDMPQYLFPMQAGGGGPQGHRESKYKHCCKVRPRM